MHSAPAVSFPAGRSRFQGYLIGSLIAFGALAVSTWCLQADTLGWRQLLAATLCLMTSWLAGWHWWQTPKGSLAWDGTAWYWTMGAQSLVVVPEVLMDLQQLVLLRLHAFADARVTWVWLDREQNPSRWVALRRAIYARARVIGAVLADVASPPVDAGRHMQ